MNGFHAGAFFWLSFVLRKVLFYCRLEAVGFGHRSLLFSQKAPSFTFDWVLNTLLASNDSN